MIWDFMMHMRHSCNGIIVCNMELYLVLRLNSNTELYCTMLCLDTTCADLTHWGQVTHICVGKLTIIGSDNGLSPGRRQAIIWTNAGILLIGPLGTNFSEIQIEIQTFSYKKMASVKWRPLCRGLKVLNMGE